MRYSKKDMISIMHKAALTYESELCHRNRLIVFGAPLSPDYIQTIAAERNFHHLTGVILNITGKNALTLFYTKALEGTLLESDFEINRDGTTQLKMEVIRQALDISKNAKMIGNFNNNRLQLKTDKIAGGVKACIGFVQNNDYYVPNTILNDDVRDNVTSHQRILAVLGKHVDDEQYNSIDYVAKNIDIQPILHKLSAKVPIAAELLQNQQTQDKTTIQPPV